MSPQEPPNATPGSPPTPAGRLLIVDDDPMVCQVADSMARALGYDPVIAYDGASALEIVRTAQEPIACVLLDLAMPGLDGTATMREIQRIAPATRVVIMTGHAMHEAMAMLGGVRPSAILPKPFLTADLGAALQGGRRAA